MKPSVMVLARQTLGDHKFLERWNEVGPISLVPEEVEVLVVDQHWEVTDDFLKDFKRLRFICSATTGHTHLKFDPAAYGFRIITLRGETEFLLKIRSVSEFTMRQILNLMRPEHLPGRTLNGKQIGVIGYGRIGKQVGHLAAAFGMRVFQIDREHGYKEWEKCFKTSDVISVHLPENDETRGIVSGELLSLMKPTAYFVNTARGSVVDEHTLAGLLDVGRIAGAALDVVEDHAAIHHEIPGLLRTNHVAGNTLEDRIRTDKFIIEKLKGFLTGLS